MTVQRLYGLIELSPSQVESWSGWCALLTLGFSGLSLIVLVLELKVAKKALHEKWEVYGIRGTMILTACLFTLGMLQYELSNMNQRYADASIAAARSEADSARKDARVAKESAFNADCNAAQSNENAALAVVTSDSLKLLVKLADERIANLHLLVLDKEKEIADVKSQVATERKFRMPRQMSDDTCWAIVEALKAAHPEGIRARVEYTRAEPEAIDFAWELSQVMKHSGVNVSLEKYEFLDREGQFLLIRSRADSIEYMVTFQREYFKYGISFPVYEDSTLTEWDMVIRVGKKPTTPFDLPAE